MTPQRFCAGLLALSIIICWFSAPAHAQSAGAMPEVLLSELLGDLEDRLIESENVNLRQTESIEKIHHIDRSRAFEFQIDGVYEEQDFDRVEVNGPNTKQGRLRQYERGLSFAVSHPLLGRRLEDRFMIALERQRLEELEFEAILAERRALLDVVGLYLDLIDAQESQGLLTRAIELEGERMRILELRQPAGEALRRDVLAAEADLARRQLELVQARRREQAIFGELAERVDGRPPEPFRAVPLAWEELEARIDATAAGGATGGATDPALPVEIESSQEVGSGFWYNVPQIDLTVGYAIHSLDRNFADERRRERGHSPEVQLSLEMPLDFYRSARAFQRQVDARHERRRLSMLVAQRRWQAALRDIELAVIEARAALSVAEAEEALQREDVRITRLRIAAGEFDERQSADVALIRAELQALDAEIRLTTARSELARNLFARELAAGHDVKLLAAALAPRSQLASSSSSRRP